MRRADRIACRSFLTLLMAAVCISVGTPCSYGVDVPIDRNERLRFAMEHQIPLEYVLAPEDLDDQMRMNLSQQFGVPVEFFIPPNEAQAEAQLVATPLAVNSPSIDLLFPSSGSTAGGSTTTIFGLNFVSGATVTFGGVAATNVTFFSCKSLRASVPPRAAAGAVDVVVTNPDTQTATRTAGFTYFDPITVTGVNPSSGPAAGGTRVTVKGTNFRADLFPSACFLGGGFSGSSVFFACGLTTVIDSSTIVVTTPIGLPGAVDVEVIQSGGGVFNAVILSNGFVYTGSGGQPATITGFSPTSGPPGTMVTITGTNFTPGGSFPSTRFNRYGSRFGSFARVSGTPTTTQFIVTVPAGANSGPITLRTPFGQVRTCSSFTVTPAGAPTITSFTPASLAAGSGSVTITGTNFVDVMQVKIGEMNIRFSTISSTQIFFFTSDPIAGPITVVTSAGTATSTSNLTVSAPQPASCSTLAGPTIAGLSPNPISRGGTLTITGANFRGLVAGEGSTSVQFTGTSTSATVTSPTQLTVTVPFSALSGPVSVITDYGIATTTTDLTLNPPAGPPTITSISPASGNPGLFVTINGTNLGTVRTITAGGVITPIFSQFSDTSTSSNIPLGVTSGPLTVTTLGGSATSASTINLTCVAPTITSFNPTSGRPLSGITINGSNFSSFDFSDVSIMFTGVLPFISASSLDTTRSTTVPLGTITGPITVTNPYGSATSSTNFTVTSGVPGVVSFSPPSGPVGSSVVINGSDLAPVTAVLFNGVAAMSFTAVNNAAIVATVPPGATTGNVTVTSPSGTATSTTPFTVTSAAPTITGFFTRGGSAGKVITISGTNFTGATSVTFNGVSATFTVDSSSVISATVPTGATSGPIAVTTPNGTATSTTNFTIAAAPAITTVSPSSGPFAGGTTVTINGSGFQTGATVTLSGVAALNVNVVSSTQITFVTPARSSSTSTLSVSITVTNPDGQSGFKSGGFTYSNFPNGDANGDGAVTVADIFYLINTLFTGGPSAVGPADVNGDGQVTVTDIFYLINYLFSNGPAPV